MLLEINFRQIYLNQYFVIRNEAEKQQKTTFVKQVFYCLLLSKCFKEKIGASIMDQHSTIRPLFNDFQVAGNVTSFFKCFLSTHITKIGIII